MGKKSIFTLFVVCISIGLGACSSGEEPKFDASQCNTQLKDKNSIVAAIQAMDTTPISSFATTALKEGCKASGTDIATFAQSFLCSMGADPAFKSDADVVNAIDELDYVDTDETNFCEEINKLTDMKSPPTSVPTSTNSPSSSSSPLEVPPTLSLVTEALETNKLIAAGGTHTCAIVQQQDGTNIVKCWGGNSYGQLGDNTQTKSGTPIIALDTQGALYVTAGIYHSCAVVNVQQKQKVKCWRNNNYGQIGNGKAKAGYEGAEKFPVFVKDQVDVKGSKVTSANATTAKDLEDVLMITAGDYHACALMKDTTVRCWGRNYKGQLGNGKNTSSGDVAGNTVPGIAEPVVNSKSGGVLKDVEIIAAGSNHTCALLKEPEGQVVCWGENYEGQLNGNPSPYVPTYKSYPLASYDGALVLAAGGNHTCILLSDFSIKCWGDNKAGQLGDGKVTDVIAIELGAKHTCVLFKDRRMSCWGDNTYSQLGNSAMLMASGQEYVFSIEQDKYWENVVGLSLGGKGVSNEGSHTCSWVQDNDKSKKLYCWGSNSVGQLGNGQIGGKYPDPQLVNGM